MIETASAYVPQKVKRLNTRQYNMDVQVYSETTSIPVTRGCFAFMFTNIGDTIARVNGLVVFPSATPATSLGDSRTISGHELDLFVGNIGLSFNVGGTAPSVEVVQLYYIDIE